VNATTEHAPVDAWGPDFLGPGFEARTLELLPDDEDDGAVATLVRHLPALDPGAPPGTPTPTRLLENKEISREYWALAQGKFPNKTIVYKDKIGRDRHDRRKRLVDPKKGLYAETHVTRLKDFGNTTLVKCQLKTGRTHQIRVHLAHRGHPIVGDPLYHPQPQGRLMLHAHRLTLTHPFTLETISVEAPSESFEAEIKRHRSKARNQ